MTEGSPLTRHAQLSTRAATAAVLAAAVGFSTISISTVIGTRDGTPLVTLVIGRFLVAGLLSLPFAGGAPGLRLPRAHLWRLVLLGGVGQAIINLLNLSALAYIPAATVVFLFYTFPAWVAVLAAVRGSEQIGSTRLVALGLSLAGIAVIIGAPGTEALAPIGVALSLAAAFAYALYIPILRSLQQGIAPAVAIFYIAVGVCLSLLVYGGFRTELDWSPSGTAVGSMLWLGTVPTLIAFYCFLKGLDTLGPVRTAIISTAEPFAAAILAALLLAQPITLPTMGGGALIAAAVLLLQRRGDGA